MGQFFARIKTTINSIEIAIIIKNELCGTSEKLQRRNILFSTFISDFVAVLRAAIQIEFNINSLRKKAVRNTRNGTVSRIALQNNVRIECTPGHSLPRDFVSSVSPLLTRITLRCRVNSSLIEIHNSCNL